MNLFLNLLTPIISSEPFGPGCPWYDLNQSNPPNIDWCEAKVCAWMVTPYNTLTNLAYVFLGIYIWYKLRNSSSRILKSFGLASIIVGLSSGIYHASLNFYTQVFDFLGMYIFVLLLIMTNLSRMNRWHAPPKAFVHFWGWVIGLTVLTTMSLLISIKFPIQLYMLVLVLITIRTELQQKAPSRKFFWLTAASFASAAVISALDLARILCFPDNHWFQGHGTWHLLTALGLYFAYRHYRQFENELM